MNTNDLNKDKKFSYQDLAEVTAQEREFVLQTIEPALQKLNHLKEWVLFNRPENIDEIMTRHLKG